MNLRNSFSVMILLALLVCCQARAQFGQRGGVSGSIFDPSGAVVPGAEVTLLDIAQNKSRIVKADAGGHFEYDNLPAGQYLLTAALQGF